jgi:hypothetical protein
VLFRVHLGKSTQAEQAAEKVDSERVLVAQALLPVLNLQHLHSAHSQEWLYYWTFSAACEACATLSATRMTPEEQRLEESHQRTKHWKRWGPYLSERQWGTVREDYSANGTAWEYFPHEHARSRAYRWGEDGIGGISDRHQRVCFALAMWNGRDPIL